MFTISKARQKYMYLTSKNAFILQKEDNDDFEKLIN